MTVYIYENGQTKKKNKNNWENTNSDEDVKNWNSHILLVAMQNTTATLENSSAVSYKVKHMLYI